MGLLPLQLYVTTFWISAARNNQNSRRHFAKKQASAITSLTFELNEIEDKIKIGVL